MSIWIWQEVQTPQMLVCGKANCSPHQLATKRCQPFSQTISGDEICLTKMGGSKRNSQKNIKPLFISTINLSVIANKLPWFPAGHMAASCVCVACCTCLTDSGDPSANRCSVAENWPFYWGVLIYSFWWPRKKVVSHGWGMGISTGKQLSGLWLIELIDGL